MIGSASPNRLSENIWIEPVVIPELEFRDVEREVLAIAAFGAAPRAVDIEVAALDERVAAMAARRSLKQVSRLSAVPAH